MQKKYFSSLSGLRFLAALFIFSFHFGSSYLSKNSHFKMLGFFVGHGFLCVSLFFILSGFVITFGYQNKVGRRKEIMYFYGARLSRIYPIYLISLAVSAPLFLPQNYDLLKLISTIFLYQAWDFPTSTSIDYMVPPAWALSIEVFFYIAFPLFIFIINKLHECSLFFLAFLCCVVIFVFSTPTIGPNMAAVHMKLTYNFLGLVPLPFLRMWEFILGIVLAKLFQIHEEKIAAYATTWITGGVIFSILCIYSFFINKYMYNLSIILMSCLVVLLAVNGNFFAKALSTKTMTFLGGCSYAIYIMQASTRKIAELLHSHALVAASNIVLCFSISIILYVYVENPSYKYLKKILQRNILR